MIIRHFPELCPPQGWPNLVLNASGRDVHYAEHPGPLSVKCVLRGEEMHEVRGGARYAVTPDRYLLLNHGQQYGSWIAPNAEAETFSIFFRQELVGEAARALTERTAALLDRPEGSWGAVRFYEGLYDHDELVTPAIDSIRATMEAGLSDDTSLEEQLRILLERLLHRHLEIEGEIDGLPAARATTRRELYRRLIRARDFLDSSLDQAVDLGAAARVACLSPHHFLRSFKAAFGLTPHQYLTRARIERAKKLLRETHLSVKEICFSVGFESLGPFSSLFRRHAGESPAHFRKR
jgi:AraC family transcriptional regulator